MLMNPEIIGYLAAVLTTAAYIPQTVKVLKTKNTQSLSWGWVLLINSGIGLWTVYGIMLGEWPLIIANGVTFVMSCVILLMKVKHG